MRADVSQVLLARAVGSFDYGRHLLERALAQARDPGAPRSHPRALGTMAVEQFVTAANAIAILASKRS